ncbi:MAG: ABC transporter ATP-binding protein [Peptococcales bacterium]|jgi:ABC-type nitrate/sulfonate/bicarbonate transport system ATPase subunit
MDLPAILVNNVSKTYEYNRKSMHILEKVSINVKKGEFVSILGPSGCGKSTLLKMIPGLKKPDHGQVFLEGKSINGQITKVGYMAQKDLLAPWKTLLENIALPLLINGTLREKAYRDVRNLLPTFGLEGFEHHYPHQLSGGMRQRAALMRTILIGSDVLLLDEPFAALDALTRESMQEWLLGIWEKFSPSILFITHSIDEAIFLSDKIYVLSKRPGRVILEEEIKLDRPRVRKIVTSSDFVHYKEILLEALK